MSRYIPGRGVPVGSELISDQLGVDEFVPDNVSEAVWLLATLIWYFSLPPYSQD
jgi:hypothetical protein